MIAQTKRERAQRKQEEENALWGRDQKIKRSSKQEQARHEEDAAGDSDADDRAEIFYQETGLKRRRLDDNWGFDANQIKRAIAESQYQAQIDAATKASLGASPKPRLITQGKSSSNCGGVSFGAEAGAAVDDDGFLAQMERAKQLSLQMSAAAAGTRRGGGDDGIGGPGDDAEQDDAHDVPASPLPLLDAVGGVRFINKANSPARLETRYELQCVVRHIGRAAFAGHYNTDVRQRRITGGTSDKGAGAAGATGPMTGQVPPPPALWSRYDDAYVKTGMSAAEALEGRANQQSAYMLCYVLREEEEVEE